MAVALVLLSSLYGCSYLDSQISRAPSGELVSKGGGQRSRACSQGLAAALAELAPTVRPDEAQALAACACEYSRELAQRYRAVRPALFHNFLVNTGLKQRGLCYQWAEDLLQRLETLQPSTLELRWGMARPGTYREHNCIVVTARDQPFADGVVLDAWRRSGRLTWAKVSDDRYPWQEGELIADPSVPKPQPIVPGLSKGESIPLRGSAAGTGR